MKQHRLFETPAFSLREYVRGKLRDFTVRQAARAAKRRRRTVERATVEQSKLFAGELDPPFGKWLD